MSPDDAVQRLFHEAIQAEYEGRFDDDVALLRRALEYADSPLTLDVRLRLGLRLVLLRCGEEAAAVLSEARSAAERDGLPRKALSAKLLLALCHRHHDPELARRLLEECSPLQLPGAPRPQAAQYFHYRGLLEADRNRLAEAERLLFRAHTLYGEIGDQAGLSFVCDSLANLLLKHGKVRPALALARRSLAVKESLGDLYGQAVSQGTLGRAHLLRAEHAAAEEHFRADLELARRLRDTGGVGHMLNSLGEVALRCQDPDEAVRHFEASLAAGAGVTSDAHAWLGLARAHLAAGRLAAAAAAADRLAEHLSRRTGPGLAGALVGLRGALAGRQDDAATGERLLREAVDALRRDGDELDTLPWRYELRDLYQRQGRTADAVRVMADVLDLLSACGADEQVSDVEQWLRRVDSPALTRLALERHFPGHLIDGLLQGRLTEKAKEEFTRAQQVTVLFSDVRNYTALSEGLAPRAVVELLNEWFAEATRVIRRHGGLVDKFIGDAVMALFGVPQPRDDAAADGVRAALGLRDALSALNLRSQALGGRVIQVGVGVHTGAAVVGFIGSHLRLSYTAIGDAVNVASRLESKTKELGCDILISQETEDGQRRYRVAETQPRGLAELKGHTALPVYSVDGWRESALTSA
jgi:class 3 adenylate cyclase